MLCGERTKSSKSMCPELGVYPKIFTHTDISESPTACIFENSQLSFCFEPSILRNILSIAYKGKKIAHNSYFNTGIFVLVFINTWLCLFCLWWHLLREVLIKRTHTRTVELWLATWSNLKEQWLRSATVNWVLSPTGELMDSFSLDL